MGQFKQSLEDFAKKHRFVMPGPELSSKRKEYYILRPSIAFKLIFDELRFEILQE